MFGRGNRALVDHWLGLWDGDNLPAWPLFDPGALPDLIPGMLFFELRGDRSLLCTFCGDAMMYGLGFDLTGKDWLALARPDQRALRLHGYQTVAAGAVSHSTRYAQHRSGAVHYAEEVLLPFARLPDGAFPVLAHVGWRPVETDISSPEIRNSTAIPDEISFISLGASDRTQGL
jgi:hypothetical protein